MYKRRSKAGPMCKRKSKARLMCKRRSKADVPAASMKDLVKSRIHNLLINEMSFLLPQ